MPGKFVAGDQVRLKGGGPTMSVDYWDGELYHCSWLDGSRQQGRFSQDALEKVRGRMMHDVACITLAAVCVHAAHQAFVPPNRREEHIEQAHSIWGTDAAKPIADNLTSGTTTTTPAASAWSADWRWTGTSWEMG